MPLNLNQMFAGWRLAGVLVLVAGAGASGMAASVKSSIEAHNLTTKQEADSLLAAQRQTNHLLSQILCIQVGIEPKLACLQK